MTDSTNSDSRPPLTEEQIRDPRKSRLLRVLYAGTKAQVERGARTLPGATTTKQPEPCETQEGGAPSTPG